MEILVKNSQHFYLFKGDGARAEAVLLSFDMGAEDIGYL
jgi:hypothetical protein